VSACLVFSRVGNLAMMAGSFVSWLEASLSAILSGRAPHTAEITLGCLSLAKLPNAPADSVLRT